jgi:hypothetical protein
MLLAPGSVGTAAAGEVSVVLDAPPVVVQTGDADSAAFRAPGAVWLSRTGEPAIPWMLVTALLPANADLASVVVAERACRYEDLAGTYDVEPTPPAAAWTAEGRLLSWPADRLLVDGQAAAIYTEDAFWPMAPATLIDAGELRGWRVARVAVPLVQYNPIRGELRVLRSAEFALAFSEAAKGGLVAVDAQGRERVVELCINFASEVETYAPVRPQRTEPGYVIITTEAIAGGSTELADFVAHQQTRGFTVQVVTEAEFGGGSGDAAAENIRNWLAKNYLTEQIQYVLLIGDPTPTSTVPMKVLYARRDDQGLPEPHPSDYYYADLTGNWDLDGDGYPGEGEPPDDFGPGGIDVHWEVLVGRIPFYGDFTDLDAILAKTIAYQSQDGPATDWRRSALLPMKPSDESTPGYQLGEQIKNDALISATWGYHRVYEETYGLTPPPETTPCTIDGVTDVWAGIPFGLVVWWTHGSAQSASGVMDTGHVPSLNDTYPAFTFQASCGNARPENSNNLAYALLKHGGIVTIGATRSSWYWVGETSFRGSSSNAGMGYAYGTRVVAGASAGLALHALKQALWNENMWPNFVAFGIYGDPSTHIVAPAPGPVHNITQDTWHASIQAAVDLARDGDQIVLSAGTYTGTGNHSVALAGKAVVIRSADPGDPSVVAATVLDVQGSAAEPRRAFLIRGGEGPDTVIAGLTIRNGFASGGGAIRCAQASNPTISDCVFDSNVSTWNGGAITNAGNSQPTITRCTFLNNTAVHGGALTNEGGSHATIQACTFQGNAASNNGGAIDGYQSSPAVSDCTFTSNTAGACGGAVWSNTGSHASIVDCEFTANTAGYAGGGVAAVDLSDVQLNACTFFANQSLFGGAVFVGSQSAPALENCWFLANTASGNGGAVDINNSAPELRNCLIGGNHVTGGGSGGGIILGNNSDVTIYNSTIVANHAPTGGGVRANGATLNVHNTILWNNSDDTGGSETAQLRHAAGLLLINYSCVADWTGGYGGTGNHGQDPLFVDPDGPDDDLNTWADNNYRVLGSSPCTDTGDPAYVPVPGELDLDGQQRIRDGTGDGVARIDMGAYEYQFGAGDLNCDSAVNVFDIDPFVLALTSAFDEPPFAGYLAAYPDCDPLLADINRDGLVNVFDIDPFVQLLTGGGR